MRILAIGDFHGKFPMKLRRVIKREDLDLIISLGDYPPWSFKKTFFRYCYKTNVELWKILGKQKYKKGFLKDWDVGKDILKKLNSSRVPVLTVVGNHDSHKSIDDYDAKESKWKWINQDFFSKTIKRYHNIRRIDYRVIEIEGVVFIGAYERSFTGSVQSKAYRKHRKKLDDLFRQYQNINKKKYIIFVSHNVPYDTKFSKIGYGEFKGIEKGSKLVRRIINRYRPVLNICGHMHEYQGKKMVGKTMVVATGAAKDGKCAIIDFDEKKGRVKNVSFIK